MGDFPHALPFRRTSLLQSFEQAASHGLCITTEHGLILVQAAYQRQLEVGTHVFEVRTHSQRHLVPAWIAFYIGNRYLSCAQWAAAAYFGRRVFLIGHVLANPGVQFALKILTRSEERRVGKEGRSRCSP